MTYGPQSQCSTCAHFRSPLDSDNLDGDASCDAFPGGIPDEVYGNVLDHREPIPGDHGIRWSSDGSDFPEYAFSD